jgi:1,4-alpha-glucan branching enzyme
LEWSLLNASGHAGIFALIGALNGVYRALGALHECDCDPVGFEWVQAQAREVSVFAFLRWDMARRSPVLVIVNFTPVARVGYAVGVPLGGRWRVVLNTDDVRFGGQGFGASVMDATLSEKDGQPWRVCVDVPPLSAVYLAYESGAS